MKSKISLPVLFFSCAVIGVVGYYLFKKQSPKPLVAQSHSSNINSSQKARLSLKSFSDERVAFKYPSYLEFWKEEKIKSKYRIWVVEVQTEDYSRFSKIVLSEYFDKHEKKSLEAIYKSKDWGAQRVHTPKKILIPGGKCLSYRLDYGISDTRVDTDGRTRVVQSCLRVDHKAHCFSDDMRYFEVDGQSGGFCDRQNPDTRTQAKIDTYEKFIRSLEIKPLS